MGRHKTISDDAILEAARGVFGAHGHTATTRQIADAVGISEAVLYQRFGNKDDLFFAAMLPPPPDVDALLGPPDPPADARHYLREAVVRIGRHFAAAIPFGLRLMTHPAFEPSRLGPTPPGGPNALRDGLAARIEEFARRGQLAAPLPKVAAKVLISLAHDWALAGAMAPHGDRGRENALREMVDAVWTGLRPA
jgi:AcrR family transcriptional regulator